MMGSMKGKMGAEKMMPKLRKDMDEEDESLGMEEKSGKLLGLQKLLGAISEITDDEYSPYIEKLKNELHMAHEAEEGDAMGVEEAAEHDEMMPKTSVDIMVGKKPPMMEEEEVEEGPEKGGFLAILAKKMKNKK